jgi:hypothetical protein
MSLLETKAQKMRHPSGPVTLESAFGICFQPSEAITAYLSFHIFGIGAAPTCP